MKITEINTREVINVPTGSMLKCDENYRPYWLTPSGKKLFFDFEQMIKENKEDKMPLP